MSDPYPPIGEKLEDIRGLSAGVTLEDQCLASIAISLKRIADSLEWIMRPLP